ncbi:extracellular solute-binding protein [Parasulfitobacter algicola]|uniref:Extracellular solute-binding protein n=1 Tax=Parasulfitobacter algicola TaxID=2614809 RepID=A0ABX2IQI7_9RHOB|nr:extracellular solute-binding protein [Sulfitobacter algicola]NSX54620.1 extracellular solute-binding protein [Sulfitobacter algicola]
MKRRDFLMSAASGIGLCTLPAFAMQPAANDIAQTAKSFASGMSDSLRCLIPVGSESNLRPTVEAWQAATGIKVELEIVDVDQINDRMTVDHLARRADYDLALPATFAVADLAWSGIIHPMTKYEETFGHSAQLFDSLYENGNIIGGDRFGFQTDGDVYLMFYRKDWLTDETEVTSYQDLYGKVLDIPQTWQELDRQIRFFHRPDENRYGGALFRTPAYLVWEFWSRMHANGVLPFDDALTPQIDSDGAVQAVEDMLEISSFLHPQAKTAGLFDNWTNYAKGDTYCNIGWGGSQKYFNQAQSPIRNKLAFSLLPGGEKIAATSYFNWGWSFVLPTQSKKRELAYLFAAFATSPEISLNAVREADGYFDPFQRQHYQDEIIQDTYSSDFLKVHEMAINDPIPDLYLPGHNSYFSSLSKWLVEAMDRQRSPKDALRRAAQDWNLISLDFGLEDQADRWRASKARYPKHVLDHQR